MLSETIGFSPEEFVDQGVHSQFSERLRSGEFHSMMPLLRYVKRGLCGTEYHPCIVESVMSGCRVTDAEALAFMQIYLAITNGLVYSAAFLMPEPPRMDPVDFKLLYDRRYLGIQPSSSALAAQPCWDSLYDMMGHVRFQKHTLTTDKKSARVRHQTVDCGQFTLQLDIGPTSACRTFQALRSGLAVGRWAAGCADFHMLYPAEPFIARYSDREDRHLFISEN